MLAKWQIIAPSKFHDNLNHVPTSLESLANDIENEHDQCLVSFVEAAG